VIYAVGGVSALILLGLLIIGAAGVVRLLSGSAPVGRLELLEGNWLVVLFKANIPGSGVGEGSLAVLNPLDLAIMVLFVIMSIALSVALRHAGHTLAVIAVVLAILGIPVFLATGMAGRSAVLVSGLVLSVAELRANAFSKRNACLGIAASALLFFGGDIATALLRPSVSVAALIAVGYLLWLIWLLFLAFRLLGLSGSRRAWPHLGTSSPGERGDLR
jgi:hypothetical protein